MEGISRTYGIFPTQFFWQRVLASNPRNQAVQEYPEPPGSIP
jgi:hypothetical protein